MSLSRQFLTMLLVLGIIFPTTAHACRYWGNQKSLLHEVMPALPAGAVAAEVEITTDVRSPDQPPLEARIVSMIAGDFEGTKLRFEPRIYTSCDGYPYPGSRGIAVGYVLSTSDGVLVIDPIRAPSYVERQAALAAEGQASPNPAPPTPP